MDLTGQDKSGLIKEDWENIFDSSFDGIWIADSEGRTIKVNKAYEKLTGVKERDVLGVRAHELVKTGVLTKSVIPDVIDNGHPVTLINKMGVKRLLVTGVPVFDDDQKLTQVVCNVRDITQLVELQQEIERKNAIISHYKSEKLRDQLQINADGFILRNPKIVHIFDLAKRVANSQSTILILGETGVGKEVLTKWIHTNSPREDKPIFTVNCSAIPESLIESELFGYEQGAFTGAQKSKVGLFEMANHGTIFLDEIGELPLQIQAKLLRVLQEKEVQRLGGGKPIPIDVRVIAATNRSLEKMVVEGRFREDLYYRINVISFTIPPLRERKEDIPMLISHFISEFNKVYQREVQISPVAIDQIMQYHWPGNIRQLKNVIERSFVLSNNDEIIAENLPEFLQTNSAEDPFVIKMIDLPLKEAVQYFEQSIIRKALQNNKSIRKAAKILEIDHSTLVRKIKQYGIEHEFRNVPSKYEKYSESLVE